MSFERKAILERYAWDRTQDEEYLLMRVLMYYKLMGLLIAFQGKSLSDNKNLDFWKFASEVSDEKFNRYAEENFRFDLRKDIASDKDISAMEFFELIYCKR